MLRILFLLAFFLTTGDAHADMSTVPAPGRFNCGPMYATMKTKAYDFFFDLTKKQQQLAKVESLRVDEIFTETTIRRGKKILKKTPTSFANYRRAFDNLWNGRVATGKIPKSEVWSYRSWLKQKHANSGGYPPIDSEDLYKYLNEADNHKNKIADYFDEQFVDYLQDTKDFTYSNIDEYVHSLDPSMVRRLGKSALGVSWEAIKFSSTAALAAVILQFYSIPTEIANSLMDGISERWFGKKLKDKSKEVTESVVDLTTNVVDWTIMKGGEEEFNNLVLAMNLASVNLTDELKKGAFDGDRLAAEKKLNEFLDFNAAKLFEINSFYMGAAKKKEEFESKMNAKLQALKPRLMKEDTDYRVQKVALDTLDREIALRQAAAEVKGEPFLEHPIESEQRAKLAESMARSEATLAAILAEWKFYRQTRGEAPALDDPMAQDYEAVYDNYLSDMSLGSLAVAVQTRTSQHLAEILDWKGKLLTPPAVPNIK